MKQLAPMQVWEILRDKGQRVATVAPGADVKAAVALLAERGVGALVVSEDGETIDGIISERDIVRALDAINPAELMVEPVSSIMTTEVITCNSADHVVNLMATMSDLRIRHVPVESEGSVRGIISIGDVMKTTVPTTAIEPALLPEFIKQG